MSSLEVRRFAVRSAHFGVDREVTVILPEAYRTRRRRYPVLYLHDGSHDWLRQGRLLDVLDVDVVVVMPEPVDRTREYKLGAAHLGFLADEVVPWADATLRTRPLREARAVHGVSLGGLCAVALGLRRPELFAAAGSQGGSFWFSKRRVVREAARSRGCPTRFHLVCGRGDGNLSDNRALHEAMTRAGIEHHYEELSGRHTWACWRRSLPSVLEDLLR